MEYRVIGNRITAVENDQVLGEITFPVCGPETVVIDHTWVDPSLRGQGVAVIDHTWVDPSLRGQGVAGQLVRKAADALRSTGRKARVTCSYARDWFEHHPEAAGVLEDGWEADPAACRLRW